jgi:hypothetical protein
VVAHQHPKASLIGRHRDDGKRFTVRADEKLNALIRPQIALIRYSLMTCSG